MLKELAKYVRDYLAGVTIPMHIITLPVFFSNYSEEYYQQRNNKLVPPVTEKNRKDLEKKNPWMVANGNIMASLGDLSGSICRSHEFETKPPATIGPHYMSRFGNYFETGMPSKSTSSSSNPLNHLFISSSECIGQNAYVTLYFVDRQKTQKEERKAHNVRIPSAAKSSPFVYHAGFYEMVLDFVNEFKGQLDIDNEPINIQRETLQHPWLISFVMWSKHHFVPMNERKRELKRANNPLYEFTLPSVRYTLLKEDDQDSPTEKTFNNNDAKLLCKKPSELVTICVSEATRAEFRQQLPDFASFAIIYYFFSLLKKNESLNENGYILNVVVPEGKQPHPIPRAVQLYLKFGYHIMHPENLIPGTISFERHPFYMYRGPLTREEVTRWRRELKHRKEKDLYTYLVKYLAQ